MSERFFRFILEHRVLVILTTLILTVCLGSGMLKLQFSNDYRMFFGEENPQLQAFEQLQNTYTKNDNLLFVIVPADGKVFTRDTLAAVVALTKQAWQIPYSLRVDSITNYQYTYAEEDDLVVEDLVKAPESLSPEALQEKQAIATSDPLLVNRLISPGAQVTGVNVTVQLQGKSLSEIPEVVKAARTLAKEIETAHPGVRILLTGIIMMHLPIYRVRKLRTLALPYLKVGVPALCCAIGVIGLLELLHYLSVRAVGQSTKRLFWMSLNVEQPTAWIVFGLLAVGGFFVARRMAPALVAAWEAASAQAQGRGER